MSGPSTVFLTGFPGFIAERLVARLAEPETRFYLLVQPAFIELAKQSIEKISSTKNVPLENFAIVRGDITQPNLGLSREALEAVKNETTDVFHLAAVYDLAVAKDVARSVNLEGTRNVNNFAHTLPDLRRYNYISTCYVAGKRLGRILETELEHDAGFRNYYEETKYLAEMEVENRKGELPVTICRPSVVVGDSQTGETAKYDGIYYLIHYLRKAPTLLRLVNVGNRVVRLNLVPVDFVVEGIATLANDDAAIGKTVALADPDPLTTAELFDVIAENLSGRSSVITPPPSLVEWSLSLPFSPPITGLPHAAVPYFFIAQTYDTAVASELLVPHQLSCPSFRDYAANLIRFVNEHPRL
jgi:thioester reductase-like protein